MNDFLQTSRDQTAEKAPLRESAPDLNFPKKELTYNQHRRELIKQRLIVSVLLIVGVVVLGYGVIRISRGLNVPLPAEWLKQIENPPVATGYQDPIKDLSQLSEEQLKTQDTDGDQLNDYDEIYIYGTNAYLADSDSDGLTDFEEVYMGEDPLCPSGQRCFGSFQNYVEEDPNQTVLKDLNLPEDSPLLKVTPAQLRQLVLESGKIPKEELDKMDDASIMEIYKMSLAENPDLVAKYGGTGVATTEVDPLSQEEALQKLESLTIPEIKTMLKNVAGLDDATLNSVDDATLRKLYEEAVIKMKTSVSTKK